MSSKLSERAMLASLTIHRWQAIHTDRKVTEEIANQHNVSSKRAGRYRKNAIDVEAPSFKAVVSAAGELRHKHYWHTLPWGQDGARILTAKNFERYSEDMRRLRQQYAAAVDAFVADYPNLREAAQRELNGLFNPTDYPTNIQRKFGVTMGIMPLPDAEDFRANLTDGDVSAIKADIQEQLERSQAVAMREPYERLHAHIARMVERLSDKEATFRDSLIGGLHEICDILPALNLTGDANLEELRRRSLNMVKGIEAQALRDLPAVRERVAEEAKQIEEAMAGFLSAMPSAEEGL